MNNYTLHISPCPNDTFAFDAIINQRIDLEGLTFDVEYHDIEELNSNTISGVAHFSKISCAILPLLGSNYNLCDSGAALGRGNGPLLVRRKGEQQQIRKVAVPGEHTTAALLMRALFPDIEETSPMLFSSIAETVERGNFDAGVLIHEGRFVYQKSNLELVADLGVLWEERTSLPLPLGAIVMRADVDKEVQAKFERVLRRSVEYAMQHPEVSRTFIKEHAQEMDDKVIESHIALFVNDYTLSLGEEGHRAIERLTAIK